MSLQILLGSTALALLIGFGGGWQVHSWKDSRDQLVAIQAQHTRENQIRDETEALTLAEQADMLDVGKRRVEYRTQLQEKTITLIKEVPQYVTPEAVRACIVPRGFIQLLNANADPNTTTPSLPSPTPGIVNTPSNVGLDRVASSVGGNYAKCNDNADQLSKVQELYSRYQNDYSIWAAKLKAIQK